MMRLGSLLMDFDRDSITKTMVFQKFRGAEEYDPISAV
jgi:hypothetical protein